MDQRTKPNEQLLVLDSNFPLVRLSSKYEPHRSTSHLDPSKGQEYKLIDANGRAGQSAK